MLLYARLLQRCLRLKTFCMAADWRFQELDWRLQLDGRLTLLAQVGLSSFFTQCLDIVEP